MNRLSTRLAVAMAGVAVVAALLGGLATAPLLRGTAEEAVRQPLARQATLLARLPPGTLTSERLDQLTGNLDVTIGVLAADGTVRGVAEVLDAEQRQALFDGQPVSTQARYDGEDVLVEARPSRSRGAIVVATDTAAVDAVIDRMRRRVLLAITIGLLAALGVAALVAGWLGRPLAPLATAARRLAAGERGVPLPRSSVTEVADVAGALAALDTALVESERRQRDFLLSVSHELRTPLTTVRGYAEGLADGVIDPAEAATVGRTLVEEATRLERYVDDLLVLARLQALDLSLDVGPVDVSEVLSTTARAWSERAGRSGIPVTMVDRGPEPLVIHTDGARLRQVVDALVDNAVRVCGAGDRVVLAAGRTEEGVRVEVRDSGPGLTEDDARVAFQPGALHERYADRRGGQGLGLAIAHRLVTRLGGTVRVERAPEGGAAFLVELSVGPDA